MPRAAASAEHLAIVEPAAPGRELRPARADAKAQSLDARAESHAAPAQVHPQPRRDPQTFPEAESHRFLSNCHPNNRAPAAEQVKTRQSWMNHRATKITKRLS